MILSEYILEGYFFEDVQVQEEPVEQDDDQNFPEFEPLRKFILIQKLRDLDKYLEKENMVSSDLKTLLIFINDLSYDTIVHLSDGIIAYIELELTTNMEKSHEKETTT